MPSSIVTFWIFLIIDGFICDYTDQRNFTTLTQEFNFNNETKYLLKNFSEIFLIMDYNETNFPEEHDKSNRDIPTKGKSLNKCFINNVSFETLFC